MAVIHEPAFAKGNTSLTATAAALGGRRTLAHWQRRFIARGHVRLRRHPIFYF